MKNLLILAVTLVLVFGGIAFLLPQKSIAPENTATPERYMDIETYVRTSISELSYIESQLGGTFFVTDIQTGDGKGVVEYEDGHNAYTADFTYVVSENGKPEILSFTIR